MNEIERNIKLSEIGEYEGIRYFKNEFKEHQWEQELQSKGYVRVESPHCVKGYEKEYRIKNKGVYRITLWMALDKKHKENVKKCKKIIDIKKNIKYIQNEVKDADIESVINEVKSESKLCKGQLITVERNNDNQRFNQRFEELTQSNYRELSMLQMHDRIMVLFRKESHNKLTVILGFHELHTAGKGDLSK